MWSYDFVFEWCANGQQLKCLTVTVERTKEGLAIEVDGCIRSGRVIEMLLHLVSERGTPLYLRSDSGPECKHPRETAGGAAFGGSGPVKRCDRSDH